LVTNYNTQNTRASRAKKEFHTLAKSNQMAVVSFLTRELEQEILNAATWKVDLLQHNAFVARVVASIARKRSIGVHVLDNNTRVPPSVATDAPEVDVDPCVEPLEEGRQYYAGIPNDYGLRVPGTPEHTTGNDLRDLLESNPAAVGDLYRLGPLSANASVLEVMQALISATPESALVVRKASNVFEHHHCPEQAPAPYMLVLVQEMARSVAAQYIAVVADATVLTHPRDLAWKTYSVTGFPLTAAPQELGDTEPTMIDSVVHEVLQQLNAAYAPTTAESYARHVCLLYDWAVGVAARWKRNDLTPPRIIGTVVHWEDYATKEAVKTTYTEQERQEFPYASLGNIERLIAETTIVLVRDLQRRIVNLDKR